MKPPSNINLSSTRAPNQPLVNHTFSLLLIGNEGVGKSSLLRRFFQGSFTQQYLPTIGIDFLTSTFVHPNNTNNNNNSDNTNQNNAQKHQLMNTTPTSANSTTSGNNVNTPSLNTQSTQKQDVINLLLYDTSGSKKFQSLIPNYLKECSVCLLCFDLTNMESYNAIFDVYLPTIHNRFGDNVILIAVGCKNDLTRQRVVVYEDIKQRTKELSIPYLETSSRNGFNVALLFNQIAKILPEISQQQMDERNNERNGGKNGDKIDGKLPNHSGVMTRDGRSGNQEGVGNEQLLDGSEGNKGGFNCMSWFKFW
jgi:small GTP-binding protein